MKKLFITIMVSIMVFILAGYVQAGMPNPAAVYCSELGYQVKTITEADGGQYSVCVFPDGNICDAWRFLKGTCGEEYSYCAKNGYGQIIKTDGKNPFSGTYPVCVDGSTEIGNPLDLMGITERLLKQSLSEDELPLASPSPQDAQPVLGGLERLEGALPSRFDWRTYNGFDWMTPVKDQSSCGACWAFGSVGTIEAVYNLHQNQPNLDINLSEEYVNTDCNGNGKHGCCGGTHEAALTAITANGVPDDACLVYDVATYASNWPNQPCLCDAGSGGDECRASCPNGGGTTTMCSLAFCDDACFDVARRLVSITGYHDVGNTVDDIKAALIAHGPLTTALQFNFTGAGGGQLPNGVWHCGGCGNSCGTNHCVIITGWDDTLGAWIIKNSWGNTDGNGDGYRFVAYNDCNVQDRVVWVEARADTYFPSISVPNDIIFADTCVDGMRHETLYICNTGKADLSIFEITSDDAQFQVTEPLMDCHDLDGDGNVEVPDECSGGYPAVISPDFCYPFQIAFSPTSTGPQTASLTVRSSDIGKPAITVQANGNGTEPDITTFIANSGNFGDVCIGDFKDLDLTINNNGGCDLEITGITSSSPLEFQTIGIATYPLTVQTGNSIQIPIRLQPLSLGSKSATITVSSNDPDTPSKQIGVSGNTPPGDIRVTGSTDFGDVCAETQAEKTVSVCNVGKCNLTVTSVAFDPACDDFELINNSFPATVRPGSCMDVVIRFTPQSVGYKECTLEILSDDPDKGRTTLIVTANTPAPSIDVPDSQSFSPEVLQSVGLCETRQPFPISNTGTCNLYITNIAVAGDPDGDGVADYSLSGLPSYPIILQPGHITGDGDFTTVFAPTDLDRDLLGTLTVTYESDPITHATATETASLCGEGVRTGARVLVTADRMPLDMVEKLQIQRITGNKRKPIVRTVEAAQNLPLQTVDLADPCQDIKFHREYGTVSNENMLMPGSYRVTATAIVNGKRVSKTVAFDVSTCDFNPNIVINF